ncbi:MAG: GTP-binding protein [Promethearchaeota archaeon]|nr:MAG: GTP-binding protein [Candidatus Lokiarchaeota archaeon]
MSNDEKGYGFKICVIGDGAVGKTSLIKKYTQGSFQKEYISTLGTQFSNYEEIIDGEKVRLFLWDIAGQDSFQALRQRFYIGSSGAIIVFSHAPEQIDSYNHVLRWLDDLKKHCGNIPIVLFGNKVDLVDDGELASNPNIPTSDAIVDKFVKENRFIGYYKTSALTGQGVTDAFKALVKKLYMIAKISSFS